MPLSLLPATYDLRARRQAFAWLRIAVHLSNNMHSNGDGLVHSSVAEYYGKQLQSSQDLKTSACTSASRPPPVVRKLLQQVPCQVTERFYGCGAPLPLGIDGKRVLDLGSGSGRDSYVCSALVGEQGSVTGIDMTTEQLKIARQHVVSYCRMLGYKRSNLTFVEGKIERLDQAGISDSSVDLVISNCVVNLSPDKQRVLSEAYRVLAPGGEFYFSDVYCDRRLPAEVLQHQVLWGECIAGALYIEDFKRAAHAAGFLDPRMLAPASPIQVNDTVLQAVVGNAKFYSITFRLFKLPSLLETLCEDYGQIAIYKGTIVGHEHSYVLDDHHVFQTNKPMLVCGNTAAMLGEGGVSWLHSHFQVLGGRNVHYGSFPCSDGAPMPQNDINIRGGSACC